MDKLCAGCGKNLVIDRAIDPVTGWEFHPDCLKKHNKVRDISTGVTPIELDEDGDEVIEDPKDKKGK